MSVFPNSKKWPALPSRQRSGAGPVRHDGDIFSRSRRKRPAAFEAIAATLPLGSVGYEAQTNAKGERLVWLESAVVDRLTALRGPGESYSDVIRRLVEIEAGHR
jgi:hypothetical protein